MNNRIVLITGATSGIGLATTRLFAQHSFRLICCGRREKRLNELKDTYGSQCHTLHFDVSDSKEVFTAIDRLPTEFSKIDILINNAGNAHGLDSAESSSLEDWNAMIDSNIKGLMYVTKAVMSSMINRKSGHIINLGSIAGKEVYPKGSVYCATKFAVDAFTKGLRLDLNPYGIKVSAIHPGLVETEFSLVRFKGDQQKAKNVYHGIQPLIAQDIAQCILFMVTQPKHVNIADLVILPTDQASSVIINRQ
ncbi:MAG: SDR family NAD(P)-dependent oxidoreductase [Flavobacteriaceae bacterium]|nr:SDR family NAD(P)-dependent oxidoreductase [Flavobacteriaceae bacterium]MCY4266880.1 SDR family NAD(P)-dependent oxidoreductase [Flavobacteriaceae bacterium]MCY4298857.1 SDR family NAD(P)-dependent oxidoreductase [Flavobacteriaceae bacterium]